MTGVYRLEIQESIEELKVLLGNQKTGAEKERVQWLYLLKSEQAKTMEQASQILGRHRVTVQKWAKKYREGGLEGLLEKKPQTGRPSQLPDWAENALEKRLQQEDGFNTYHEIGEWLEENLGISASYNTVHYWVHYRLKASPKVLRPQSSKQDKKRLETHKKTT